jgi:HSP20 family protein
MVSLRDAMDRLVSESFIRPRGEAAPAAASLAVDVREEGDNFVITAPVPGIAPDDVEITVLGDTVRIRGERREERQEGAENQRWLVREQRFGFFERVVRLPTAVKADAARAEFQDGILRVTLPKTEEAKERRIPVLGGQQAGQAEDVPVEAATSGGGTEGGRTGAATAGATTTASGTTGGGMSGGATSADRETTATGASAGGANREQNRSQ